jgi:Tfp pilus tip-associated adhesin PilY1
MSRHDSLRNSETPRVFATLAPRALIAALTTGFILTSTAGAVTPFAANSESDTDLFRTNVPPNILLIVDNSKSMTNTVWHTDYGVKIAGFKWKNQTACTHFRDAFTAAGNPGGKFNIYPGGRRVSLFDTTGWKIRTRRFNNKAWEPAILDTTGTQYFDDVNGDGVMDPGDAPAYYKTCNPANDNDYVNKCGMIADLDGDGLPGQTVRDAFGVPIVDAGTGRTQIYKSDPDDTAGLGLGGGSSVRVRTTITPQNVARAAGILPTNGGLNFEFDQQPCGIAADTLGYELFTGESAATTPNGSTIIFQPQYLDFLFSSPYGDTARPAVFAPTSGNDGVRNESACLPSAGTYETYRRTRLMALRLVLRTVTCELDADVRFGIMQFRYHGKGGDDNGGYVVLPVESINDSVGNPTTYTLHGISDTHANHMARVITGVGPDAQTPLNESIYQAYTYFMSRDSAQLPPGRDYLGVEISDPGVDPGHPGTGTEVFPVYEYNMDVHNPIPDDGGDLNMVGGHYVGNAVVTTHPKPVAGGAFNADGLDPNGNGGNATFPNWDGSSAPDPVQYACQKNFILLITDGGSSGDLFDDQDVRINAEFLPVPAVESATDLGYTDFFALIGDHARNPDGTPDQTEMPGGGSTSTKYMDDITLFMNKYDFRPDLDGDQTIDTYTVGYSVDSTGVSNVELAAQRGNGTYFESADADQLAADIVAAFTDIIEKAQSFTSATVPASRTTDGDNFYSSFFRPRDDSPFWEGHLKNFAFTASGDILTAPTPPAIVGNCAVGSDPTASPPCPNNGTLRTDAEGYWDAAEEVPAPDSRNLYVGDGSVDFSDQAAEWGDVDAGDLNLSAVGVANGAALMIAPYNLIDPTDSDELDDLADELVSHIAGCDYGTFLGSDCITRTNEDGTVNLLSDIFHSNPVVVGSPNAPINEYSYRGFSLAKRTRKRVIYSGANDGWLHGFLAGTWQAGLVPPRHDRGTGEELMAFMPSEIRDNIWKLPISQPSGEIRSYFGVDGSPISGDAWIYRNVDLSGNLTTVLSPAVSTSMVADQWRTVLLGSLRGGGQSYFALDVSDPDDANYPGYMWEFPCDDCGNAINGTTRTNEANHMGFSFSDPVIARVRVHVDGQITPGGHDRWVAIFGAGYHQFGDPNQVNYVDAGDPNPAVDAELGNINRAQGRAIYMIDLTTGRVLAKKRWAAADAFDGPGQTDYNELEYAFPSSPAVFDLDFDGYSDLIVIGDAGGNIWKWVIKAVGDDPINNTIANHSEGQPNWPFKLMFKANHSTSPAAPTYGVSHFQNFFFPPTGILKQGQLVLAIGAGERINPEAGLVDMSDLNNNHYFVVRDKDPLEKKAVVLPTLVESDLIPTSQLDDGTYTCDDIAAGNGYYLTGRDREKFITNSVIFLGDVFTGSFVPSPVGSNPCEDTGDAYLYRFSIECGEPGYPANSGGGDDKRRNAIGSGLPTRPRVSAGGINQGGSTSGCTSRVVVITSDGSIDNECPDPLPSSGVNLDTWRER